MGPLPIGPLELVIILVIALLILGPGKLPEVGSSLGRTIREFRRAASDVEDAASLTPRDRAASSSLDAPSASVPANASPATASASSPSVAPGSDPDAPR